MTVDSANLKHSLLFSKPGSPGVLDPKPYKALNPKGRGGAADPGLCNLQHAEVEHIISTESEAGNPKAETRSLGFRV